LPKANLLIQELLMEAKRDLEASDQILKTDLIEIAAWHTEQAFEKAIMYVYASYKTRFLGRAVDSVYEKMKDKPHTDKHILMLNMLNEMIPDFGGLVTAKTNSALPQLTPNLSADLSGFLLKVNPSQNVSKAMAQLGKLRSALDSTAAKSMSLGQFLDRCTVANFKKDMLSLDVQSDVEKGLESLIQAEVFKFRDKDLENTFKASGVGQPDLYVGVYRFPLVALNMARWILKDPISTRYPLREWDYANLRLYRARSPALHDFYQEVNRQIETLIQYGEEFLQAFSSLGNLGIKKL